MTEVRSAPAVRSGRADAVVAATFPDLSRSRAAALVKEGRVRLDGEIVSKPSASVDEGAALEVEVPAPAPMEAPAQSLPLKIVHEDAHLVVVDKAPGRVVHPGPGHPDGTLVNALLHHVDDLSGIGGVQRPGIVHRLDKGTSGLLVVAKHDRAHRALAAQFAAHTASRRYLALVFGAPASGGGTVRSRLARHPRDRLRWASTDQPDQGKEAITHWRRLGARGTVGLVECRLETGRTHQVRVHLCELGHPLIGDPTYRRKGCRVPARLRERVAGLQDRPLLHAWSLALDHPESGERVRFVAPPPDDLAGALDDVDLQPALPAPLGGSAPPWR
jgi:23S rRNA pseudouridine1911/1915/1917 synthase